MVIIADGARPDTLASAMEEGRLPALAAMREEGGFHTVTSCFPSVTGPAYTPFIMGRFPGDVGLPGLRWFDRSRRVARLPGHSRSYVGPEMRFIDSDLDPSSPTIFELCEPSIGALSVIRRGLPVANRVGTGATFAARTGLTHFRGNVPGWLRIDRAIASQVRRRIRDEGPRFTFAALTGIDKTSHAEGHESALVAEAFAIVDETAGQIRRDAERDGRWARMHLWVCSDHGHSRVLQHEDLVTLVEASGSRRKVLAHPWAFNARADIAVMVSGNAMAHLYVDLDRRERPGWNALVTEWHDLVVQLEARDSVDLILLPKSADECEVRGGRRGSATITRKNGRYQYLHRTGNPLGIGEGIDVTAAEAHERTLECDYPDAIVQIAQLSGCTRSGDIILSAARDWDFRARYEPIPHVSSHGALHRDHMLVPLLLNRAPGKIPRRTIDLMPSALSALGITIPSMVEGESFTPHY